MIADIYTRGTKIKSTYTENIFAQKACTRRDQIKGAGVGDICARITSST